MGPLSDDNVLWFLTDFLASLWLKGISAASQQRKFIMVFIMVPTVKPPRYQPVDFE